MNPNISRISAEVDFIVPFHDLDPMEIVWHGNYMKYFEYARTKLCQKLNYDHDVMRKSGYVWPVVDISVKYIKPLRYQQRVKILAWIEEWENRLKIAYLISDFDSGERLTKGHTIQVAVNVVTHEMSFVSPDILCNRVKDYLYE